MKRRSEPDYASVFLPKGRPSTEIVRRPSLSGDVDALVQFVEDSVYAMTAAVKRAAGPLREPVRREREPGED